MFSAPDVVFLDLPQLTDEHVAHHPLVAADAKPWPGRRAVWRSPASDRFELVTTFGRRARVGVLVDDLYPGPTSRLDLANAIVVDLRFGSLDGVPDIALFGGANALAVETSPGVWESVRVGRSTATPRSAQNCANGA